MAYMNQEKKVKIAAALKAVMPKGWKYSLGVNNHSTIVLTIASAPVDLIAEAQKVVKSRLLDWQIAQGYADKTKPTEMSVNHYHLDGAFTGELLATFEKIVTALNLDNHDRSDAMTDHYDVGHYVSIHLGRWNKPFVVTASNLHLERLPPHAQLVRLHAILGPRV